jgi:hypothetical protein
MIMETTNGDSIMYFVFHEDCVPESVANRHKWPAIYGPWRLFISGIERETGIPPTNVLDVASMLITNDEFIELFTDTSSPRYVPAGAEVQLSGLQGIFLMGMFSPPTSEDI